MKKTIGKRIVAILLTLCMMISIATMSVTTSSAGSLTNFAINRLYTSGLLFAGKVVNKIAQATDVEEIEALGSFIYIWVCGGNNNASDIAEVNALCEEILAEVYRVETKLDSYSGTLGQMQANLAFGTLLNDMNATFENDVTGEFGELSDPTSLSHAFLKYFNSEDLEKLSDDKQKLLKEDASYLVSCYMYKNEIADENGELFTLEEIENKRESLLYAFCGVRGIDVTKFMDVNGNLLDEEGLLDALFAESTTTNPDIDATVRSVMESLTNNLVKSSNDSYADLCAQVAYAAFPSLSDQYEYIMSNISKQFMAICLTEMMYQEYLSIRGEYLETYHNQDTDADKALWSEYQCDISGNENKSYDGFDDYNRRALDSMELRLSTSLKLDTAMFMSLDDYVRNEDTQGIVLYDNNYYNWTTVDEISMEYMPADMLTTLTRSNGVEVYYMLSGDKNGSHNAFPLSCLVQYTDFTIGADRYEVTSEVRNFMQNPYSDSHNTYECAVTPENVATLFQTPSFALYGSSPYSYLGKYYADDDVQYTTVYQLLDYTDRMTIDGDKDERDVYKGVNMKGEYLGYDPNAVDTYYLDAKSIYTNGYTDRDNDTDYATNENVYNQGFSVILYNTSDTFKKSLSCTVNGDSDMYITDSQGNIISSGSSIESGTDLQIHIKPIDNALIPSSLKLNRYNDTQHPNTVTNTVEIMNTADDFYPLNTDSNGYYVLDFSMPYSNAELVLETEPYKMSTDINGNFIIESYDDLLVMADKVNSGEEEYTNGSYVVTNDIVVPEGEMWTNPIGQSPNFFEGTFDGQGYTISGLAFEGSTDKDGFGLFDLTSQATIKNVNLDVNFKLHCSEGYAVQRIAGLCAGASYNTDISNCTVSGNILVTADSGYQPKYVGGVCGILDSRYGAEKCINYCNIDANAHCVGGVCGYATNGAQIINCANTASVKAYQLNPDGIFKQPENCAGIIGETQGNASVTNCYNTGVISGDSSNSSIVSLCAGKRPVNCYYLDTCAEDEYATAKSIEQFNSGEVTYLLNSNVGISEWAWFQNIDNGKTPDEFPTLTFTINNVVFKVDREDKTYSNIPNDYLLGDADLDGKITIMDATTIQWYCAKRYELTKVALINADTSKDYIISISDATKIQIYIAKITKEF